MHLLPAANPTPWASWKRLQLFCALMACLALSCTISGSDPPDDMLQTQIVLGIQQTALAESRNLDMAATQQSLQLTLAALEVNQQAPSENPTALAPQAPATSSPPTQAPPPTPQSFEAWMKDASILLYEDMAGETDALRYIKMSLDAMGLDYTDTGDAQGDFKDLILTGGPKGQGWDLIIAGSESRSGIQGEFFIFLNDALNLGSSVIVEVWDVDAFASGQISTLMNRCGVEFQRDWFDEPLENQLVHPLDAQNPILHQPNDPIRLTSVTGYWTGDLGDFMRLTPGSEASLFLGARAHLKDSYGTAASCLNNQLIIQTHSTHQYAQNRSIPLWQNYIYHTLLARFASLS